MIKYMNIIRRIGKDEEKEEEEEDGKTVKGEQNEKNRESWGGMNRQGARN